MCVVPHVIIKGRTFHFRRKVPSAIRVRLGRSEIVRSLKTSDAREAALRSKAFWLGSEGAFRQVTQSPHLTRQEIEVVIKDWLDERLWNVEIRLATEVSLGDHTGDDPPADADRIRLEALLDSYRDALARNDLSAVSGISQGLLDRFAVTADSADGMLVARTLLRAVVEYTETALKRLDGDYPPIACEPPAPSPIEPTAPAVSQPIPIAALSVADPEPLIEAGSLKTFKVHWAEFSAAMVHEHTWTKHTALQSSKSLSLWLDFAGDRAPMAYDRITAADFRRALTRLPADYGKSPKWRGLPLRELVAHAETEGVVEFLTQKTVARHLSALSSFWRWLAESGRVPKSAENLFSGFSKGKRKSLSAVRAERGMWEPELLRALFATPVWTGCLSAQRRTQAGPHIIRDHAFWVPLIGLFTGMRLEEICQLAVGDIRRVEGIWVFDVHGGVGLHIKNSDSERLVPIHRTLLRLGLIEQMVSGRPSAHRLFNTLTEQGPDGKLGLGFTKWFSRYRKLTGIYDEQRDFHSLRHTVTTLLVNARAHPVWLDELIGHANPGRRSESSRYTKAVWLSNLRDTIELLDPRVDLSALMLSTSDARGTA